MLLEVIFKLFKKIIIASCFYLLSPAISFAGEESEEARVPANPENADIVVDELTPKKVEINSVERLITPITQWVEGKIQTISVVKPSVYSREKNSLNVEITLREAIKLARKQFQGTILGADKVETDSDLSYQIKILSSKGIVKTITINSRKTAELYQHKEYKPQQ